MSLAELLTDLPDIAVHTLDEEVSREGLAASVDRLSALLAETGLTTGEVVAAMMPNDATTSWPARAMSSTVSTGNVSR